MVDKSVAGGLDDWEVKIADFVVLLGKDAKNVSDALNLALNLPLAIVKDTMDLRDIIRSSPDHVVGHKAVRESLNVVNEAKRFARNPVEDLINAIGDADSEFTKGDIGRYLQAYSWYSLCVRRTLEQCSVARRADSELRYHPKNRKYSGRQKQLASKHNEISQYCELDYQNLIIHAYILLDRAIALSRRFIVGGNLPSFTSFWKHKKFLKSKRESLGKQHAEYVEYITNKTDWHSIPLKVLRDKYLMHSSERHMSFFGWSAGTWDLEMATIISANKRQKKLLEKVKTIVFSPRRLARDVEEFLSWFGKYGASKLR